MLSPEYTERIPQRWLWLAAVLDGVLCYGMYVWLILASAKDDTILRRFFLAGRALVAWILCASISITLEYHFWQSDWGRFTLEPIRFASRTLASTLPIAIEPIVLFFNASLLLVWFEPFVLRLNLWRGLVWVGLRIAPFIFAGFVGENSDFFVIPSAFLFSSMPLMAPLWGWRSRPWMPLVSMALVWIAIFATGLWPRGGERWGWLLLYSTLYGIPLIYGTRLLSPEEREKAMRYE